MKEEEKNTTQKSYYLKTKNQWLELNKNTIEKLNKKIKNLKRFGLTFLLGVFQAGRIKQMNHLTIAVIKLNLMFNEF